MLLTNLKVNSKVKLDFFHLEEKSSTNVDIFSNKQYKPTLNNYSRFLVSFDSDTTVAEGVADIALGYTFSVYREAKDTNSLVYVATLADGDLSMVDYNVVNNNTYRYYIFKEDESAISEAVVSNDIQTCWWDWSFVDVIPSAKKNNLYYAVGDVWKFNLNVSSGSMMQNMNNTTYNNLTKFPKVSAGKLNYSSGSLSCLLGGIQKTSNSLAEYIEPNTMLESWNDFCSNGNIKLMKDRKGNAMLVMITDTSAQVDDITREQANTITFSWVQVDNVNNVAIIGG